MSWLLDTNVISEAFKPKPNAHVRAWLAGELQDRLYLSALSIGELRRGVESCRAPALRQKLDHWLEAQILPSFRGRILSVDERVAQAWGRLCAPAGRSLPSIDSLLAATAVAHGLVVLTRNTRDFELPGLRVLDPFAAGPES